MRRSSLWLLCLAVFVVSVSWDVMVAPCFGGGRRGGADPANLSPIKVFEGHKAEVRAVAFSFDGKILASAGGEGTVRLWNVVTGKPAGVLKGHEGAVHAIAFTNDGTLLASAGADKTVRLWSVPQGDALAVLPGHTDQVAALAFSPNGQMLASGGHDKTVKLWDVAKRTLLVSKQDHADKVLALAFSADGKTLATGGADQTVRLCDPSTGVVRSQWNSAVERKDIPITALAFTANGKRLAVVHAGLLGRIDEVAPQKLGPELYARARHTGLPTRFAFRDSGAGWVACNSENISCGDSATGAESATFKGDLKEVLALAYDPLGGWLATGGSDRAVKLWSLPASRPFAELEHPAGWLAFDAKGQTLYAQGERDATIWDVAAGKPRVSYGMEKGWVVSRGGWTGRFAFAWPLELKDPVLKVRKDGKVANQQLLSLVKLGKGAVLANANRLGQYALIDEKGDINYGMIKTALMARPPNIVATSALRNAIGFMIPPAPKAGATDEDEKAYVELRLLKAVKGSSLGGYSDLLGLAFSPDGKALAVLETGGLVHLWDAANGVRRGRFETELSPLSKEDQPIGFSADSKTFFLGHGPAVHMWDATTGKKKAAFMAGHYAHAFATTPDGKLLATGGHGGGVRLWDIETGQLRQILPIGSGHVAAVAFTPDGKTLVAADVSDPVIRAWDIDPTRFTAPTVATGIISNKAKFTFAQHRKIDGDAYFTGAAVTSDGKWVVSAGTSKLRVWNPATGTTFLEMDSDQIGSNAEHIAVSPDGKLLATVPRDGKVKVWNLATKKEAAKLAGGSLELSSLRFSSDNKTLWATPARKQPVLGWDVATGKETSRIAGEWDHVSAISPDGKIIVGLKNDEAKAGLWDLAKGAFTELTDYRTQRWFHATFSPDGRRLAVWHDQEGARLFDAATGKLVVTLATPQEEVQTVEFDPAGKLAAIGLKDGSVRLWDLEQQKATTVFREHAGPVNVVAFGPGGRWFVSGGRDILLKVIDIVPPK